MTPFERWRSHERATVEVPWSWLGSSDPGCAVIEDYVLTPHRTLGEFGHELGTYLGYGRWRLDSSGWVVRLAEWPGVRLFEEGDPPPWWGQLTIAVVL